MRKILLTIVLLAAGITVHAQLNKAYFYFRGREFLLEDKYREAIRTLNVLLRVDSTVYEGYFLRGIAKYNLDDLIGAEADFTEAIRKNPVFTTAYQYRAITRSLLGNYDDALRDFAEAIDLRPDLPGAYFSRGVTLFLSQQFEKAIADFDAFIYHEPRVADAYLNRGTCYLMLKDTVRAYEDYDRAIRTNNLSPDGYLRRGTLHLARKEYARAFEDFNTAIRLDSLSLPAYFNRAIANAQTRKPMEAITDFGRVLEIDSTNSLTYFNRAILRSQVGDYNKALEDYGKVAFYSPNNVLVYYNRGHLNAQLGFIEDAIRDYSRAIELYPDFANAYLSRAEMKYLLNDRRGYEQDKRTAEKKIAEYRSKLTDSAFSVYADTSRQFNKLLAFDADFGNKEFENVQGSQKLDITLMPLFKLTAMLPDTSFVERNRQGYRRDDMDRFLAEVGRGSHLRLTPRLSDIPSDSAIVLDRAYGRRLEGSPRWTDYFMKGVTQNMLRQYTNAMNNYNKAIALDPDNPFLYLNRSTAQSEMVDFISSIDNNTQRIVINLDPVNQLKGNTRIYNYDAAIADLDRAISLAPDFAHLYYNRGNLRCLSGNMAGAIEDYTRAIELYPALAEAYYNRGLVQLYLKDTRKGCLDISKAGELGIEQAYAVLKKYGAPKKF